MHLFILDLLGRDTRAAQIFRSKTEEDFRHTQVVTRSTKVLCVLMIVAVNVFFALFTILRGYQKGLNWQMSFLKACIVQLLVEVLLFETVECVWIQYVIPNLAAAEVGRINRLLSDAVSRLCIEGDLDGEVLLNAPDYLFVSANLAKAYPHLMEAILVQSYLSYLPGQVMHKWGAHAPSSSHQGTRGRGGGVRYAAVLGAVVGLLQTFAAAPYVLHEMFIRFVQPFFLAGLVYVGSLVLESTLYTVVSVMGIVALLVALLYHHVRGRQSNKDRRWSIQPIGEEQRHLSPPEHIHLTRFDARGVKVQQSSNESSISGSILSASSWEGSGEVQQSSNESESILSISSWEGSGDQSGEEEEEEEEISLAFLITASVKER
jgi:hypothetical protein